MGSEHAQLIGAVVAMASLLAASAMYLLARSWRVRSQVTHPAALRLLMVALWLLTASAFYSATAFLWSDLVPGGVLDVGRFLQLALRTATFIVMASLVVYVVKLYRAP